MDDVVMVRWPAERERLGRLRRDEVPRLVMVEPEAEPPGPHPGLEDWIRLPAPAGDVRVRVDGLLARAAATDALRPRVDDDGLVRFRGQTVSISPAETAMVRLLVERWGSVVGRDSLSPQLDTSTSRNALDAGMSRLRRRLAPLGLSIRTVRRRGYVLELAPEEESASA